jgi:small subunit ribosomal protein S20
MMMTGRLENAALSRRKSLPTRSAAKAHRSSLKRQVRNRAVKRMTRTRVKQARTALADSPKSAEATLQLAVSALDRAVKKGVYHRNKAARQKSRLMARLSAAAR